MALTPHDKMRAQDEMLKLLGFGTSEGVWLAHSPDWATFSPFPDEISCLRYAVQNELKATYLRWGRTPHDPSPMETVRERIDSIGGSA